MDTPPNSAVMKVFNDIDSPTGRRIKGPPTAGKEDPERTSHESRAGMEKKGSTCRPQDQLAERNEGSATTFPTEWRRQRGALKPGGIYVKRQKKKMTMRCLLKV